MWARASRGSGEDVFQESFAVKEVVCMAVVPPAVGRHTETGEDGKSYETSAPMIPCAATCTLVVPLGSKTLYEQAEGWKEFGTIIVSADITGVKNIVTEPEPDGSVLLGRHTCQHK